MTKRKSAKNITKALKTIRGHTGGVPVGKKENWGNVKIKPSRVSHGDSTSPVLPARKAHPGKAIQGDTLAYFTEKLF